MAKSPSHLNRIDLVLRGDSPVVATEELADSWRRCVVEHHLDPNNRAAPEIITEQEIRVSQEPLHDLILHAQEEMDRLYTIVRPQDYVVLLCNRDGVAVHHRGEQSRAEDFKYWGIWLGGVWAEDIEGTNGIGTCITEQRPAVVHHGQHFRMRHTGLSCAGAPIFDPCDRLTAVLDTSTMNPQATDQSLSVIMAATQLSARGIEERVFRDFFQHAWNIAAAPYGDKDTAVLLAVDNDQRILGADHIARQVFELNDERLNRGMTLATIFEYDSSIFRGNRMQDIPVRLLRKESNERWNLLVTPPACRTSSWCSPTDALLHSRPRLGMLTNLPLPVIDSKTRGGLAPASVNRIREYIDSHLREKISLEALADIAQLSVHHFAAHFDNLSACRPIATCFTDGWSAHTNCYATPTSLSPRLRSTQALRTKAISRDISAELPEFLLAKLGGVKDRHSELSRYPVPPC